MSTVDKAKVLGILKPHMFFDDEQGHLEGAAKVAPSVHAPFGSINRLPLPADSVDANG